MNTLDFPFCCTARIIVDFGQSEVSEGTHSVMTVKKIQDYISDEFHSLYNKNLAMITVTTNSDQVNANQALKNLDFEHSTWMEKGQHAETMVRLWWKSIPKHLAEVAAKEEAEALELIKLAKEEKHEKWMTDISDVSSSPKPVKDDWSGVVSGRSICK